MTQIKQQISVGENVEFIQNYGLDLIGRNIYLNSMFSDSGEPGVDYRMSVQFSKNINILNSISSSVITVYLNSIGGSWVDAMAIYDMIKLSKSKIIIKCFGECTSATSIIPQAAHKRYISPKCKFMLHNLQLSIEGDYKLVNSFINQTAKDVDFMYSLYAERCVDSTFFKGKDIKSIIDYFKNKISDNGEYYISAEESLKYGLCDGIL